MQALLVLMVGVPLVGVAVALFAPPRAAQGATVAAGVVSFGMAIALALDVRHGRVLTTFGGWLRIDSLGAIFALAAGLLYATGAAFSIGYLRDDERRRDFRVFARRYFTYLNLFGWSMLLVPAAADFGSLWIAIELTTIISALMVALDRTDAALEASWKYVLIASSGLGIALLAIIILYAAGTGHLGDAYLPRFHELVGVASKLNDEPVKVAFMLAAVGFGTKVGFVPMHTWLPDAHSEAPSPVSALLSGALLVDAFYGVLRFYQVTVASGDGYFARRVLIVLGIVSLAAASFFVLRQKSYKRLLAYSSVEHMGIVALGIGFGVPIAVAGALLHVVNHAAAKGLAFFGAGSILRRFDTKQIERVNGGATVLPWSGPMFLAAALALSGLPLSGIFRSEFQIVSGGFSRPAYVWVALMVVFVNIAFFGIVWYAGRMVLSPVVANGPARGEKSWWMVAPMVACLIIVVGIGVHLPSPLSDLLNNASHGLANPNP